MNLVEERGRDIIEITRAYSVRLKGGKHGQKMRQVMILNPIYHLFSL